jgi:xylan 1,4-beta-xylosidase
MLHRLGDQRLSAADGPVLATRRADGSRAVLGWNLPSKASGQSGLPGIMGRGGDPVAQAQEEMQGDPLRLTLRFAGLGDSRARVTSIDMIRGSALTAWQAMGKPEYPTAAEIRTLRDAASLPAAETRPVRNGELTLELPPSGLALVEVQK